MSDSTRRGFLALAGAGAAAVGAAAVVSVTAGDRPISDRLSADRLAEQPEHDASGPLVAWVGDVDKPEMTLMVGDHEVVLHDADLVSRLARAAAQPAARAEGA